VWCAQPSQKTFKIKRVLAKKAKQNRPIPQWIRFRTNNKIRSALPCHSAGLGKRWVSRDRRSVCHTSTTNTSPTIIMSVRYGFLPDVRCLSLFGLQLACQCVFGLWRRRCGHLTWPRGFGGVLVWALRVHCVRSVHCVTLFWLSDALCVPWRQVQCKAEALAPHKAGLVDGVNELAAMGGAHW